MAADPSASSLRKGIFFLVTSAFGFALMGMFVHLADFHGGHISAIQKSCFRNLVALALAAALFARGRARRTKSSSERQDGASAAIIQRKRGPKVWALLMARAVFGTVGIFGNFYALSHMPVADALMLNKLSPFFTVLFSWLFIHERITVRQALGLMVAFAGAVCVVKPGFGAVDLLPAICGVVGGIGAFLGDFFFYPAPMFVSLVTHGLQAVVISLIAHRTLRHHPKLASIIGVAVGAVIMVVGYSLGRAYVYSTPEYALLKLPFQILQAAVGAVLGTFLCWRCGIHKLFDRTVNGSE